MGKKSSERQTAYLAMQGALREHVDNEYKYATREIEGLSFITKYEWLPVGAEGWATGDVMGLINVVSYTGSQVLFGVGIARANSDHEPYLAESSVEHKLEDAKRFVRDYKNYMALPGEKKLPNRGSEISGILRRITSTIDRLEAEAQQEKSE